VTLEIATLVAGSETPAGDGISGALRCVLVLPDRSRRAAVLKRGAISEVAAEAFCALLLRAWGIPVPDPFLVVENDKVAFASGDVGYPNLKQSLGLSSIPEGPAREAAMRLATDLVCSLSTAPITAACDEAVDNRDRNLGNVLWDGKDEVWIDHALTLGNADHLPDVNKLCMLVGGTKHEENFTRAALAQHLLLERACPLVIDTAISETPLGARNLAPLVTTRLATLGNRLLARFPKPTDLLSGP
jgi:hypothetical protein